MRKQILLFLATIAFGTLGIGQDLLPAKSSKGLAELGSRRQPGSTKRPELFSTSNLARKDKALAIQVNEEYRRWIWENEPESFRLTIPYPGGEKEVVEFVKANFLTEDFEVRTSDGRVFKDKEHKGLHYQRVAVGNHTVGGLSFSEDRLMGMIATDRGQMNIGEYSPGRGDYVISSDSDIMPPDWRCDASDLPAPGQPEKNVRNTDKAASPICKTVRVYFESDFYMFTKAGSTSAASTFLNGLFNVVAQLYAVEGITVKISTIFQWTSTDPYYTTTSTNTLLYNFAVNRPPASLNGDIAHLVSARNTSIGGIGYVGVFCNTAVRHAFSSIYYQYSALPTYSWSVYCITHEMGHNFGSRHTHWCGWTLPNGTTGRIDSCYAGEGTCSTTTKARKGTIMSYCHLTSQGVDFNLGFGTLPGKAIRDGLTAATCISASGCLATASLKADSADNKDNGYTLSLSIPANHNAASWQVLEGTTILQSGTLANQNATTISIPVNGKSNGTYNYSAVLISGTNSTTSSQLTIVVNVPAPSVIIGNCAATGLRAYKNASGQWCFQFGLSATCTNYTVQMCRYSNNDPNTPPPAGATPVACGVRNSMNGYVPTTAERLANLIDRVANPQPSSATTPGMGSFWYSIDVLCTGTGCTTANRTRTYFFVPGI